MKPQTFLPQWIDGKYCYQQPLFSFEGRTAIDLTKGDINFPVTPMPRPDLVALGWRWGLLQHLFTCEEDMQWFARRARSQGTELASHLSYTIPIVLPDEDPVEVLTQLRDEYSIYDPGYDCGGTGTDVYSLDTQPQDCVDWVWEGRTKIARFRKKGWGSFCIDWRPINGKGNRTVKVLAVGVALSPQQLQLITKGEQAIAEIFPTCAKCRFYSGQVIRGQALVCGLHPQGQRNCPDYEVQKPKVLIA